MLVIEEVENMTAVAYERENQLEGMICMHALVPIPILTYNDSLFFQIMHYTLV